ncbi:DNA/RNA nuclease SfsA [Aquifex pyrophilus]
MPAVFLRRLNRFVGEIFLKGRIEKALIRNTGRLEELLKFGNAVFVREKKGGKYGYEIILSRAQKSLVCIESHYAVKLYEEYLREKGIKDIKREVKVGKHRFDFLVRNKLVEVKSVNLVKNGVALFPDAPTKRGASHIRELIKLSKRYNPLLVFVVQREDFYRFMPNCERDREFCEAFYEYVERGFPVEIYKCSVGLEEVKIVEKIPFEI